ncbi:DUF1311 domain-containing protein [Virgibacillus halodenitrificans]|uniref:lysozyme inhibitor LprI family protein n=1 Tax=Virgibacillus halodenitrificans TaxID=1482 RepID=UPI00136FD4DC|nr:lysozyme inhibitor LprI family protein [Virgibacillus halodenitrificans]MYL45512.1 DUF1311 domain-containing protein [Virgibacillus halodenitrificans]
MKNNRRYLIGILMILIVLMAACGTSSDESSAALDNESQNNNNSSHTEDDPATTDAPKENHNNDNTNSDTMDSKNNDVNEQDKSSNVDGKEGNATSNTTVSLKEQYLKKLNDTKKEVEGIRKDHIDDVTYVLKSIEGNVYDTWDGWLNGIYSVLEEQQSEEQMDQLRKEQREWINYRDHTAKEASLKYKGGTMEQLEYVTVQNNLTLERCFELVENFME